MKTAKKRQYFLKHGLCLLLNLAMLSTAVAALTDIASQPIQSLLSPKPNIVFILDDSGSMDFELLLKTNDGSLWWNAATRNFTDNTGAPWFNTNGSSGSDGKNTWYKYSYLFPNGYNSDGRALDDQTYDHFALPPTPAYSWVRSSDYNPSYYNPALTYLPWPPGYANNKTYTFTNASTTATRSHPIFPLSGTATTLNLAATLTSTTKGWTFRMLPGMVIPGATISGIKGLKNGAKKWSNVTTNYTIPSSETWDVAIPYYPATYYLRDSTCTSGWPNCITAPDGKTLRRYQISVGNTFPSGRSYSAELQNFANWFTYYRKHDLLLAAAAGQALTQVTGIRGGVVNMNNLAVPTMYDFGNASSSQNGQTILGAIYTNPSSGGTPTRQALNYVGNQYQTNKNLVQYSCQYNATMVLTDGFAQADTVTVPSYNAATWGSGSPYQQTYAGSLADLALAYYTLNIRPDLPSGLVPIDATNTAPNADSNTNLHMNTYGLTIGALGTIFGSNAQATADPYTYPPTWPLPNVNRSPTAVDDLWHATINARGLMFSGSDVSELTPVIQNLVEDVIVKAGTGAAGTVSSVNINSNNNQIYLGSYNSWYGELAAFPINTTTGNINTTTAVWSARALLDAKLPSKRIIATYSGAAGVPLQWASLPVTLKSLLNSVAAPPGPSDGQNVLAWLRGDKSLEGSSYRSRANILGDIVDSKPIYVGQPSANYTDNGYASFQTTWQNRLPVLYVGANDGMLHTFNANTGDELWAYVPNLVFNNLNALASRSYSHRFYVDGSPVVGDIYGNSAWHTILVGGLRAGGNGYYAIEVTNPQVSSETALAANVLWEFPNANTASTVKNNVGLSFGEPIIAKTKAYGWVVLVTSGYNNSNGDGKGHLFVLDPLTGNLIKDLPTTSGTAASPAGLAKIAAFAQNQIYDATIDYVYGGDLNGNVWRFDLSGSTTGAWNVALLATLVDSSGNPQPVTTTPELAIVNNQRLVYVGTGKILGNSDLNNTKTQSMYALVDNMQTTPTITPLRANLQNKAVSGNTIDGSAVNYATYRGWYFDLPLAGEQINTDPIIAFGAVLFTSNQVSAVPCAGASFLYVVSSATGGVLPSASFNGQTPWARTQISSSNFSVAPLILTLPNGKVVSVMRNVNNIAQTINLPLGASSSSTVKRVAWKEILLQ